MRNPRTEAQLFVVREATPSTAQATPENFLTVTKVSGEVRRILQSFPKCFREELPEQLPPSRNFEHSIDIGDATPINLSAYPLSPLHLQEQSRQIAIMLKQGLIQESSSPWGFPVLFVKKPGEK